MKRIRYILTYARTRRALSDARKAWRGMTPASRLALVDAKRITRPQGITSAFDPHNGWVEELPYVTKPTLFPGMSAYARTHPTGQAIGYLRWVLYAYCGYAVRPSTDGPWSYSATTMQGVYNTLAFFGAQPSYYCSEPNGGWDVIDFVWAYNQ